MRSNRTLENFVERMRLLNYTEYELCLELALKWHELCPEDGAHVVLIGLTYTTSVVFRKQFVWTEEFPAIVERTALQLLRKISDQISIDGLNRAVFRQRGQDLI